MTTIEPAAITSLQNRGGKGHAPRKTADYEAYASNYDLIFGNKTKINSMDDAPELAVVESLAQPNELTQTSP